MCSACLSWLSLIIQAHLLAGCIKVVQKLVHMWPTAIVFNPLTTDDAYWCCQFLAACYRLAQSVLKIGSTLAERVGQGEVGGCTPLADSAWWLLQLAVNKPWSMLSGPFVYFLAQMGVENAPFTL